MVNYEDAGPDELGKTINKFKWMVFILNVLGLVAALATFGVCLWIRSVSLKSFVRRYTLSDAILCPTLSFVRRYPLSETFLCPTLSFVQAIFCPTLYFVRPYPLSDAIFCLALSFVRCYPFSDAFLCPTLLFVRLYLCPIC